MPAQAVANFLAPVGDRLYSRFVREVGEDRSDLLVDRRREDAEVLGARLLGGESGIGRVGREN